MCASGLTRGVQSVTFSWLMKYLKKHKSRTRSDLKHNEPEKNVTNYDSKCKTSSKNKGKWEK